MEEDKVMGLKAFVPKISMRLFQYLAKRMAASYRNLQ